VLAAMLGTSFTGMVDIYRYRSSSEVGNTVISVGQSIVDGDMEGALDIAAGNREALSGVSFKIGNVELGHQKGVFSDVVKGYSSGSFIATVASIILNITGSTKITSILFMLLALIFIGFETVFVSEIYKVVYTRVFLECRVYDKVGVSSVTYLLRTKKWAKASLAYLRFNVYSLLWWFTIVGGIIKHYSYALVRYILAENPDMSGKDAILLSRKMMDGHKWELFLLDLSFIGWDILGGMTAGVLTMLYVAPYKEATRAEYYAYLRAMAKAVGIEGSENLNDVYLYEVADKYKIDDAYSDVIEIMNRPGIELKQPSKVRAFFQDVFGVVLRYDKQEMLYRKDMTEKASVNSYKKIVDGQSYPYRLSPIKFVPTRRSLEHQLYMRHYSVPSLILIFFSFCLVGWLWEVAIHIVNDGVFVNRGVMHGPWLPIYGSGAVLILMVLNKFRKNPLAEFMAAIALCGAVEYFGSWALEKLYDGQKWWDYTGYFLNINGRICAEGLLVFGLAGVAAVYFIAPMLDNNFARMDHKIKNPLCAVLVAAFIVDMIYSHFVPNTGKGITDYGEVTYEVTKENYLRS